MAACWKGSQRAEHIIHFLMLGKCRQLAVGRLLG